MAIDYSKFSLRDQRLFSSFRLDQPLSQASNGKYIADKWLEWAELKRADIARAEEAERVQQANPYQTRATTHAVVADSNKGRVRSDEYHH